MIRPFLTVSSGTLASRLLGFVRDSMVAALLGAGPLSQGETERIRGRWRDVADASWAGQI